MKMRGYPVARIFSITFFAGYTTVLADRLGTGTGKRVMSGPVPAGN
jgi:hypothetical protein